MTDATSRWHVGTFCWALMVSLACASQAMSEDNAKPEDSASGKYGLLFDGRGARVEVADFLYDGEPATLEAMALPHSDKLGSVFVDFEAAGIGLHFRESRWLFNVSDNGTYRVIRSDELASREKPAHLAGVFDGKMMRLYVNGQLQTRLQKIDGPVRLSQLPFWIGANPGPGGAVQEPFLGRIDAVRMTKGALYSKTFKPPQKFEKSDDTLLLLNFEEGMGNVAKDESGHDRNGKIIGATWVRIDGDDSPKTK